MVNRVCMPRKSRIDAPGALQHVIGRGINRQVIFSGIMGTSLNNQISTHCNRVILQFKDVPIVHSASHPSVICI